MRTLRYGFLLNGVWRLVGATKGCCEGPTNRSLRFPMVKLPTKLTTALPAAEQQNRYARFIDLMRLLGDCIIAADYTIPDSMNESIHLSVAGEAMMSRVATAKTDRIPAKEARLLCALAVGGDELFVDIDRTDLERLAESISQQIVDGKIRFPANFGRETYDAFASLFEEPENLLTYEESQRLLDATPAGVHQYGRFVTGPYGLHTSASNRQVSTGQGVDGFHCSNTMCDAVHRVHLTTSREALINSHRSRFSEVLDEEDSTKLDWFGAADDIRDIDAIIFADAAVGVVATLIGDALSEPELRKLVAHLFDETGGDLRDRVKPFLDVRNASAAVAQLTRAQLMQIALLADEPSLQGALDVLVEDGDIRVPRGEVRRPVVNKEHRSGAFGLQPELGRHGVRFAARDPGFATLRLRQALGDLFDLASPIDIEELDWQIRHVDGENIEERLDTFFRVTDPAECIDRLVMTSRKHVVHVAKSLKLTEGLASDDATIVERILWKLGYPLHAEEDPRHEFWRLHERLTGLTQASHSPGSRDTEEFLGVASKFFRELERYLSESLAFAAWALLHDHSEDPNPFQYGLEADHARGMEFVQSAADASVDQTMSFDFLTEKLDIYTLIRGFNFLAKHLESLANETGNFTRPAEQLPAYARGSKLKRFPFGSTAPFLNLTERSRERISKQLLAVSQAMQRGKVNEIRNEHQHYRKTASGVEQIEAALREIEFSMRGLEASGFGLVEFRVDDAIHDRWGRSEYYLAAPRGARHVITRPSSFDWLGLPDLEAPQYVIAAATFAEPNEVLRFRRRLDSEYTQMWVDFPSRRRRSGSALRQTSIAHAADGAHG